MSNQRVSVIPAFRFVNVIVCDTSQVSCPRIAKEINPILVFAKRRLAVASSIQDGAGDFGIAGVVDTPGKN